MQVQDGIGRPTKHSTKQLQHNMLCVYTVDTAHSQLQQLKQSYLYILSRGVCPPSTSLNLLINKDKTVLTVGFVSVLHTHTACCVVVVLLHLFLSCFVGLPSHPIRGARSTPRIFSLSSSPLYLSPPSLSLITKMHWRILTGSLFCDIALLRYFTL